MRRDATETSLGKTQSRWYGAWVLVGMAAVMTPAFLLAAGGGSGGGFDSVVRGIESRYHVHANKIPFMSLVSGIAAWQTHGSVHNLHVAEFEEFQGRPGGRQGGWRRVFEAGRESGRRGLVADDSRDQSQWQ